MDKMDHILKYIFNELTPEEKEEFEKQLTDSTELRYQLNKEQIKLNLINEYKSVEVDDRYFINIYPRFLQKLDAHKSHISIKSFSAGFSFVIMIFLMLSIGINTGLRNGFYESLLMSTNEEEILSYLNSTSFYNRDNSLYINYEEVDHKLINTTYNNQIYFETFELKNYININNVDVSEVIQNLDSDEFDSIYESLTEIKFL
ncbi:MAG: hypothetical protein Q8N03_02730 [Ignavibacteria bacterium]|nr:hypothetical protein [Ignavibacteria bacterium]